MAKAISWKRSITTDLNKLKEKAKSIMSDSDSNTQDLIDMSAPTLNSVAEDIEKENLSNVNDALKESNINLDPSANTPNRFPNYISSLNPLNRNNWILNKGVGDYIAPSAYDTNTANVSDNIFKPNLVTTPWYSLANKMQTLIDSWYKPWVDADLLIRTMEKNWYWYDTSLFDDKLLWDTTGMTEEQINLLREQKSKEYYAEQSKKNQDVYNKINALTPELLKSFDEDVREKAEALNTAETQSIREWLWSWFDRKWALSDMHDIQEEIAHRARQDNKNGSVYATDVFRVVNSDWKGSMVSQDEFDNYLINYMEQLEAYKNWEVPTAPDKIDFYVWGGKGYRRWESGNKSSVYSKVSNDELESMYNVYQEWMTQQKKKEEIDSAIASEMREQLWLQDDEKVNVDWIVKAYKDYSQIEDEKKDLETKIDNVMMDTLQKDQRFLSLNSVQQQRIVSNMFSNVSSKIADKYNYIQQYDTEISKIVWNVYQFSSNEEKQNTLNRLTQLRNETKQVIDTYIQNAAEAELIYAQHWGDEVSAQKEMRERMWWWEDEWLDVNVLSAFYMKGIDESNTISFWLDVDNRLLDIIKQGIWEMDDILYNTNNEWWLAHAWHEFEYWAGTVWEALEGAVWTINYLTDFTPLDWGMYAAGETQLWVYKENYQLAWDAERFYYNIMWIAPEVTSMFLPVWWAVWWWAKMLSRLTRLDKLFNNVWRFSNVIAKMDKAITEGNDVAKATKMLWNYVKNDQWVKLVWNFVKETVENYWQDAAFFNRWDTEYMTWEQDWWTNIGALFWLAHADTLWVISQSLIRWGWNIIDSLRNRTLKNIGKWWAVAWSFIDTTRYFSEHPDELASAVLREMWLQWDEAVVWLLDYIKKWNSKEARAMLNVAWQRIFEQSRQAARILDKMKKIDTTWMLAAWEKQYVGAMLSSILKGTNNVNNRELVNMIENAWYQVPDMLKRYTNSVGTMVTNSWRSSLFTKLDAEKIHLVDYDRRLDLVTDNTFSPTKVWDKEDIQKAYDWLDRMWVGYKNVFENPNSPFFKEVWAWQYVLTKEWLDALWYSNNKLVPEVLAQSKETTDFVENLRKINNNNKTEVISESLINEIEQTDAYERLSSALSKYVC